MPVIDFEANREYDDEQFSAVPVHVSEQSKTICGYFQPGQFIPVHAPDSDLTAIVQSGTGIVREGDTDHRVQPGDAVVVPAGTDRGIRADDDTELEVLLVVSPPPGDAEHEPVRQGLRTGQFEPEERA